MVTVLKRKAYVRGRWRRVYQVNGSNYTKKDGVLVKLPKGTKTEPDSKVKSCSAGRITKSPYCKKMKGCKVRDGRCVSKSPRRRRRRRRSPRRTGYSRYPRYKRYPQLVASSSWLPPPPMPAEHTKTHIEEIVKKRLAQQEEEDEPITRRIAALPVGHSLEDIGKAIEEGTLEKERLEKAKRKISAVARAARLRQMFEAMREEAVKGRPAREAGSHQERAARARRLMQAAAQPAQGATILGAPAPPPPYAP